MLLPFQTTQLHCENNNNSEWKIVCHNVATIPRIKIILLLKSPQRWMGRIQNIYYHHHRYRQKKSVHHKTKLWIKKENKNDIALGIKYDAVCIVVFAIKFIGYIENRLWMLKCKLCKYWSSVSTKKSSILLQTFEIACKANSKQ